jgi:flavin-dependent amine oxidoreductase
LRPLGLESELTARRLDRAVRRRLMPRRTLAHLAADLGHPHLAALVRGSAYRCGSVPEDTPAMMAVEHAISRSFGRWQIQRTGDPAAAGTGRTSVLVEALAGRLALRKVAIHTQTPVIGIEIDGGRVTGVLTQNAHHVAAAVVCTADPWQTVDSLLRDEVARVMRRRVRRLKPAAAPMISHALGNEEVAGVTETVSYTAQGVPMITYRRPAREQSITSVHDFRSIKPSSSAGVGWQGFRTFLRRPPITTEVAGLFLAGPSSPAGAAPSAVVLSSALAAGGCQNYLLSVSQQG